MCPDYRKFLECLIRGSLRSHNVKRVQGTLCQRIQYIQPRTYLAGSSSYILFTTFNSSHLIKLRKGQLNIKVYGEQTNRQETYNTPKSVQKR